jgi:hypothetical protein
MGSREINEINNQPYLPHDRLPYSKTVKNTLSLLPLSVLRPGHLLQQLVRRTLSMRVDYFQQEHDLVDAIVESQSPKSPV